MKDNCRLLLIAPGGVHESGREAVIPALLALIERLARRHAVTVVALRQYPEFRRYRLLGAEVINLGYRKNFPGFLNAILRRRRLLEALRAEKFDLIHAFWLDEPAWHACGLGKRLRVPVVASLGGGEMARLPQIRYGASRSWPNRAAVRRALRSASAVTGGSDKALGPVRELRRDARKIPLFSDHARLLALPLKKETQARKLLQVASVNRVKDPFTMIRAMRLVAEKCPDAKLDWVGADTLDGEARRLAAEIGVHANVAFHGFKEADRLPEFFGAAHLFAQSSLHESQGVAVCEAAAAGLPIVGTDVGLVSDLAPDRAVAIPTERPDLLAGAILSLIADEALRNRLGRAGREWAAAHGADWTAEQFESLYSDCLAERGGAE